MALGKLCVVAALATCAASLSLQASDKASLSEVPEWCKPEEELTAAQRKAKAMDEAKLLWARKEVLELREKGQTVPDWMDELVSRADRNGKQKWAAAEAKRLRTEGQEVPVWVKDLADEAQKGADRWAACKVAEMKAAGEEVPGWLAESARKGIMDAANEKISEIQEEINELEGQKDENEAKVEAGGDTVVAEERRLARTKANARMSVEQQGLTVSSALEDLKSSEGEEKKEVLKHARDATKKLLKSIEMQMAMMN